MVLRIFFREQCPGEDDIWRLCICPEQPSPTSEGRDMIRLGEDESHIETVVEKNGISYRIEYALKEQSERDCHRIKCRDAGKQAKNFRNCESCIFLAGRSEHYQGAEGRKKIHQVELSQLDKVYLNNLSFNRIVNQRNHLLKELSFGGKKDLSDTLEIWELPIVYNMGKG